MASFIPGPGVGGKLKKLIKFSIVDDIDYDRLHLKRILEQSVGFTCASMHASTAEALDLIPKVNPHLAFLDVRMPGMNGLECTRRLKILMPQLKIIIVSGLLDVETMNESLQAPGRGARQAASNVQRPTSNIQHPTKGTGPGLRARGFADHILDALRPGFPWFETEQLFGGFQIEMETLARLA